MDSSPVRHTSPAAGSFHGSHYSPGKLYTQFRIADGRSPVGWHKMRVFQADSPSTAGLESASPSPDRRRSVARRLDTGGPNPLADGETTPVRHSHIDKLFRANVPAARLLARLTANPHLPPLMRKREHAYLQRRLLELVQPSAGPSDEMLVALSFAASNPRELPSEDELLAHPRSSSLARQPASSKKAGKFARSDKAPLGKGATPKGEPSESTEPQALSAGVSKTSGRALIVPARLREPASEQHSAAKRSPARPRQLQPAGAGQPAAKAARGGAGQRLEAAPGQRIAASEQPEALLLSPGGSPLSAEPHLRQRHGVRLGPDFQAELPRPACPACEEAEPGALEPGRAGDGRAGRGCSGERGDELLWRPPQAPRPAGEGPCQPCSAAAVTAFLERLGFAPKPASAAGAESAVSAGGVDVERCLQLLLAHRYDLDAAAESVRRETSSATPVTWTRLEVQKFERSLRQHGGVTADLSFEADPRLIQQQVGSKSLREIVHYFCLREPGLSLRCVAQSQKNRAASPMPARTGSPAPSSAH